MRFRCLVIVICLLLVVSQKIFAGRTLKRGDQAPDFTLRDAKNNNFSLRQALATHELAVIIFYPKDNSPVCTEQLCKIRDRYPRIAPHKKVWLVGISGDNAHSHQEFAAEYHVPFPLLIDKNNAVRKAYHAYTMMGTAGRATFIINKEGMITDICTDYISLANHIALIEKITAQ